MDSAQQAHSSSPKETITIKKDHFYGMLAIGLLVIGFAGGFILGDKFGDGSGGGTTGGTILNPSPNPSPSPTPTPAPSPDARVKVSVDDDPVLGKEDAPVTIIEFSDYQCPFCGRFFQQTYPSIKKDYIDTGKVKLVFRDYPLSFHPEAEPSAIAAECVDELDRSKYFDFHDKIFQNQATMSAANYKAWAKELGLDEGKFNECFDGSVTKAEVQKDFADGSAAGVSGTPTFFIGNDKNGYVKLVGAQPYAAFQAAIDAELK